MAYPWPVNLLAVVPVILFFWFRRSRLTISWRVMLACTLFGIAFGFVEASVVIYLRAVLGFLPGYLNSLTEAARQSFNIYQQNQVLNSLPKSLFAVEFIREAATMIMLLSIGFLAGKNFREKVAMFLWSFAVWDIFYYVGLWLTIRWPYSLATPDVLFLIPVPWYSQIWFPLLISVATLAAIGWNNRR